MTVIIEEINVDKPWSFIWLMYVRDVDLKKHCKPCLKGYSSKKINKYSFNGITIKLKNAKRVEFSEEDIPEAQEFRDRPEYYTCRNWQFANRIKDSLHEE